MWSPAFGRDAMKSAKLIGKEVVGMRGWRIGKVSGINFDETTWNVISLDVRLFRKVADELRMKRVLLPTKIEVAVSTISAIGDRVILSVPKPSLRRVLTDHPSGTKTTRTIPPLPEPPRSRS